jgi:7-cyano-7-deazaguanine synthase in queuosine biosynthesis
MNTTNTRSTDVPRTAPAGPCVNLLWTGGWDSTFRLLQLLLLHRVAVAPHYLEDPTRASTQIELETMARIAGHLRAEYPHTGELLQPLRIASVANVAEDAEIDGALQKIRERVFIGSQYSWLPAYCKHSAIGDMELGVHVDDKVQALLRPFAMEFDHPGGFRSIRVDPRQAGSAEFTLFRYFSFPLFRIDKVGIDRQAEAAGWSAIMDMTWFCHSPARGRPCGICAPCVYTIEEGLARRVPFSRRVLSYFYRHFALPMKGPLRRVRMSLRTGRAGRHSSMPGIGR